MFDIFAARLMGYSGVGREWIGGMYEVMGAMFDLPVQISSYQSPSA